MNTDDDNKSQTTQPKNTSPWGSVVFYLFLIAAVVTCGWSPNCRPSEPECSEKEEKTKVQENETD